jgi:hypothetical protein
LKGRADNLGDEIASFGLPLPFGFLKDSQNVRIVDECGAELPAAIRSLEPWAHRRTRGFHTIALDPIQARFLETQNTTSQR